MTDAPLAAQRSWQARPRCLKDCITPVCVPPAEEERVRISTPNLADMLAGQIPHFCWHALVFEGPCAELPTRVAAP